jgi:hypothetical protein
LAANPQMVIRIAADLAELKKNLAEGKASIETTTAAMTKLATSFSGDRLIQSAHNVVAAVNQIGGASKLTEAEQARVNATVQKALEKYQVLGKEAPQALRDLEQATRRVEAATAPVLKTTTIFGESLDKLERSGAGGSRAMGLLTSTFGW